MERGLNNPNRPPMEQQQATMAQIQQEAQLEAMAMAQAHTIGKEELKQFTAILQKYKAGKNHTERRIVESENWWKLRNAMEAEKNLGVSPTTGFKSVSGWLHNVIVSKHADAVEAYPEANVLPREEMDRAESKVLSAIIPCILEQNEFEGTYSDVAWQKLKTGTGVYKIVWDKSKLNGLGDISIEKVNLLNLYWEPGITDIQNSRYFFHTELCDKDILEGKYPELKDKLKGNTFLATKFLYDDTVSDDGKVTVIDVYYHKTVNGKRTLQFCKYVSDIVLFATENVPEFAEKGLYDHGKFPYIFDALFPIEGSPCGYGFVDLCRNPQTEIDLLKTAFVKNAMVGATPRYFARTDGSINEEELLDITKPVVHVNGNLGEDSVRQINFNSVDGVYVNILDRTIQELRETSGNTETSTGNTGSGVTAGYAIAALQEASGKGSRDSTKTSYRAYTKLIEMTIELIRQFYDMPRQFRVLGEMGVEHFITYTNEKLKMQQSIDMGLRLPVFDVKVSAQKKNIYTKASMNELAVQFFQMGMFNPQLTDQSLLCLEIMDFDGKDGIMQKISKNGTLFQKLVQYMQMALQFAQIANPAIVPMIMQDMTVTLGPDSVAMAGAMPNGGAQQTTNPNKEPRNIENARARSQEAAQPSENGRVK